MAASLTCLHSGRLGATAGLFILACHAAPAAAQSNLTVLSFCQTSSVGDPYLQDCGDRIAGASLAAGTLAPGQVFTSAATRQFTVSTGFPVQDETRATTTVSRTARADFGSLGAAVSIGADIDFVNGGYVVAEADSGASFIDVLTVQSATLAQGTPVSFTARLNLHIDQATMNLPFAASDPFGSAYTGLPGNAYRAGMLLRLDLLDAHGAMTEERQYVRPGVGCEFAHWPGSDQPTPCKQPPTGLSLDVPLHMAVGETLRLEVGLRVGAVLSAQYPSPFEEGSVDLPGLAVGVSAMNTLLFSLTPDAPGYGVATDSGVRYAAAVPEPAAAYLMLLGLSAIGLSCTALRQRRSRIASLH